MEFLCKHMHAWLWYQLTGYSFSPKYQSQYCHNKALVTSLHIKGIDLPSEALQIMTVVHTCIISCEQIPFLHVAVLSRPCVFQLHYCIWSGAHMRWVDSWMPDMSMHRVWALPLTEFLHYWALNLVKCSKYATEYCSISTRDCHTCLYVCYIAHGYLNCLFLLQLVKLEP